MNARCPRCRWLFTAAQWDHAQAEGFDCPLAFEAEPDASLPRRVLSYLDARLAHGYGPEVHA